MQRSSVVLPAPFGPAEREALARLDAEREVAQHDLVAEAAGEAVDLDHGCSLAEPAGPCERPASAGRSECAVGVCSDRRAEPEGGTGELRLQRGTLASGTITVK